MWIRLHRLALIFIFSICAGCSYEEAKFEFRSNASLRPAENGDAEKRVAVSAVSAKQPNWFPGTRISAKPLNSHQQSADFYFERVILNVPENRWHPEQVAVGDVTLDGLPDIVLSMSDAFGSVLIRVYSQTSQGTLALPMEFQVQRAVNAGHALELAHLDSTGGLEIVVADDSGLTILANVNGLFLSQWYPASRRHGPIASFDENGDGHTDLFVQHGEYGASLFYGNGRLGFDRIDQLATGYRTRATVEASDYTADGLPDIVVSRFGGDYVWIYPFLREKGLQRNPIEFNVRSVQLRGAYGSTVGDFNRDGRPDLVVTDQGDASISPEPPRGVRVLYRGLANDHPRSLFLETPGNYSYPSAVRAADLDGNGYLDIVVMLDSNDRLGYFLQSAQGFSPVVFQATDDNPWTNNHYGDNSFVIADVNSDRCPDIVLAESSSSLRVFYGRNCHVPGRRKSGPHAPLGS